MSTDDHAASGRCYDTHGTVVVSDGSYPSISLNTKYSDPSSWVKVPSGYGVGYSRSLIVVPD